MTYALLKIMLMTTAIGMSMGRSRMLALCYFYVWALSSLILSHGMGQNWYWGCAGFEGVIIVCALFLEPRGFGIVITMSALNICANSLSLVLNGLGVHAFYPIYPVVIRFGEMVQCLALILYSDVSTRMLKRLYAVLLEHRHTFMLRSLVRLITS